MYRYLIAFMLFPTSILAQETPPRDWQHLDAEKDSIHGVSVYEAYKLLEGKKARTVTVAVIDSGVDIEHEDLQGSIWVNEDEVAGNGIDDDGNGYTDDVYGWNFLGGADGTNIEFDTYEITRQYAKLREKYGDSPFIEEGQEEEFDFWKEIERKYRNRSEKAMKEYAIYRDIRDNVEAGMNTLKAHFEVDTLDLNEIIAIKQAPDSVRRARAALLNVSRMLGGEDDFESLLVELDGAVYHFEVQVKYGYNTEYNPREVIGDNWDNPYEVGYGNNDVEGPFADHGTHVSGIIAAKRNNNLGIDGIAPNVKIMSIRTVPNGDERDKDVAAAIRYAVDNGARVINMSFGKSFENRREVVDSAVDYAVRKNVLMVFGAGNSSKDLDVEDTFPTPERADGSRVEQWISVGAVNWTADENFPADFSNYGQYSVDMFAPGVRVTSAIPDNKYEPMDGTSMAAPVVTGVAALIMSYFPELSAKEVQDILMNSVTKYPNLKVIKPGSEETVPFSQLSISGGVVNAKKAVMLAMER
jgi:cell wall-associated protease